MGRQSLDSDIQAKIRELVGDILLDVGKGGVGFEMEGTHEDVPIDPQPSHKNRTCILFPTTEPLLLAHTNQRPLPVHPG